MKNKTNNVFAVGITLHDNDFSNTFESLLESLDQLHWWTSGEMSQEDVRSYIMDATPLYYKHYQIKNWGHSPEQLEKTLKYINSRVKILFNVEAQEYLVKNDDSEYWYWEARGEYVRS